MTDREDRLRSLLDKVRAKRPAERETHAAEALDRIRTASGTMAATAQSSPPLEPPTSPPLEPPTSPQLDSPSRYSSQPPTVERPLSVEPRARSFPRPSGPAEPPSQSQRPAPIRPQSVAPTGQPVVYATDQPEFPRPSTFGELLELTLSLRPR